MSWISRLSLMDHLRKQANFGDIAISFGTANINSLKNMINNITGNPPADQSKIYSYNNVTNNPDLNIILSNNGQSLISAKSIEQVLAAIHGYEPNLRAEASRLSGELEKRVQLRQQDLAGRYDKTKKVTSFRMLQATSSYVTYAISWTSHIPGKEKAYLFSGLDPNAKAFNPVRLEIQNRMGIQLLRQPKVAMNEWVVSGLTPDRVPELAQIFTELGYDASAVLAAAAAPNMEDQATSRTGKFPIIFDNVSATTAYHLAVVMKQFAGRENDLLPTFIDIVQKVFTIEDKDMVKVPQQEARQPVTAASDRVRENIAQKREQFIQPAGSYYMKGKSVLFLKGSFSNFQDLQKLLAMKGFDTTDLINKAIKVGSELRQSKHIKVHKIVNGVLDGYYQTRSARHRLKDSMGFYLPDEEKFQAEVSQYLIQKPGQDPYRLFPMQGSGVQWLYSRQSALLGDETGVGKCLVGSSRVSINDKYYTLAEAWNCFADKTERISEFEEWGWSNSDLFVHSSDKSNKIVKGKIARLFRQKYTGPIICTSTSSGKSVMHTPQHHFLTPVGWRNNIKVGDYVCSSSKKYESINSNDTEQPKNSLQEIVDNDLYYEQVTSIRKIEWDDYVYDLSVENYHNYIAENLICHNTEQLVVAADMRTKEQNLWDKNLATGKIAVFTLASVVNQFAKRILQVAGLPSDDQFLMSTECPVKLRMKDMNHPNAKWLVLSYGKVNVLNQEQQERQMGDTEEAADAVEVVDTKMSGTQAQRQSQVAELMKQFRLQNFDVMILDESHMVKNSTSNTSKNIELLGKTIPFKWGASATVSANKPPDLHRQLLAVGNSMGFMTPYSFNKRYTGMQAKKIQGQEGEYLADPSSARDFLNFARKEYKGFDDLDLAGKQDIVKQLAEENLRPIIDGQIESITDLHAMLILTDVYQRKTKKQVKPDIPEHHRQPELLPTDEAARINLTETVNHRLENMALDGQDSQSELTRLTAYRIEMALQKVQHSASKAIQIVQQGQKVLIFTCFKEPAVALEATLKAQLQPYGMGVYMAMGGSGMKHEMIEEFRNPESLVKIFVLGVLSSGTGLDLPNIVNNVIVNDISWTPKDADQVEGRAFRVNSESSVTTHYMVLADTPDAVIYKTVQKKRDIAKRIQNIDEQYAEKIRTNQSTRRELKAAQHEHWSLVKEQLIAETAVQHFWVEQQKLISSRRPRMASNWLQKNNVIRATSLF